MLITIDTPAAHEGEGRPERPRAYPGCKAPRTLALGTALVLIAACGTRGPAAGAPPPEAPEDSAADVHPSGRARGPTLHRVVRIERPGEVVFDALTAFERIPEWIPSIRRAHTTSDGPIGIGTTFVQEFTFAGRRGRFSGTVTEHEPGRKLAYVYDAGPIPGVWQYVLTPRAGGTDLEFSVEMSRGGFFSTRNPLLLPIVRRMILKNLNAFRVWVEEQPTG